MALAGQAKKHYHPKHMFVCFGQIGWTEILVIVAILVLVFGASQIPKIARSLGEGMREFKKALRESRDDDKDKADSDEKKKRD